MLFLIRIVLGLIKSYQKSEGYLNPGPFKYAGYPKIDENTVVKIDEGSENGIPHFYVTLDDILTLFENFEIVRIRHTDDCYVGGKRQNSKHYFILAKKLP